MADKHQLFKQRLGQVQEAITSAIAFYTVWNKLRLHDPNEVSWSLDRQNQILGRWNAFFTPVGIALQRMAMVEVAKVFDKHRRSTSLTHLLSEARRDPSLIPYGDSDDLVEIEDRLRRAKTTREIIKKLRDQRLAHADANPDPIPPLISQKVASVIEDIKYAFNRLSAAHDNNSYTWDHLIRGSERQTTEILGLLLKEIERAEMEYDDRMVEIVTGHIRGMETTVGRSLDADEIESVSRQFSVTPEQYQRVLQELRSAN